MEVEFLKKRDIENKIRFTDLNAPDYNPIDHGNVKFSEGMRKIRAVLPDNSVVSGVEVFRQVYGAIGLGWMFEMTNVPIIGKVADAVYDIWAENRLRLTGRADLADKLKLKSSELRNVEEVVCDEGGCSIVGPDLEVSPCGDQGCALEFD
jgi:predicted DCC family thiol-disulfide oxidoreductase YuxK